MLTLLIAASVSLPMTPGLLVASMLLVASVLLVASMLLVATVTTLSVATVSLLVLARMLLTSELPSLRVTSRCRVASRLLVSIVAALAIPGMALLVLTCVLLAPVLLLRMRLGAVGRRAARRVRTLGRAGEVLRVGLPCRLVGEGVEEFPRTGRLRVGPTGAVPAARA